MRVLGAMLACLVAAGCQSTARTTPPLAFDADAARFIHDKGVARIEGQALFVRRDGTALPLAREIVRLVPATPHAAARFEALYRGKSFIPAMAIPSVDADRRYSSFSRTAKTSTDGVFTFDGVAPGTYFVTAQKIYTVRGSFVPEGGAMYETVRVGAGDRLVTVAIVGREEGRF